MLIGGFRLDPSVQARGKSLGMNSLCAHKSFCRMSRVLSLPLAFCCIAGLIVSLDLQACDSSGLLEVKSFRNQDLEKFPAFQKRVTRSFTVPGLAAGFVPQGIAPIEGHPKVLLSGYVAGEKSAVVILIDENTGQPIRVGRLTSGGNFKNRHAGGLVVAGDYFWIPGNGVLLRFPLGQLLAEDSPDCVNVEMDARLEDIESRGSYLAMWGDYMVVGDFGSNRDAHLPVCHHRSPGNRQLRYRSIGFKMNTETVMPANINRPSFIIHHGEHVQGIAIRDDGLVLLSRSWGDNPSRLELYRIPIEGTGIKANTTSPYAAGNDRGDFIPSVSLSEANHLETILAPPGSEGIIVMGNRATTVFEGGAYDYRDRWKTLEDRVIEFSLVNRLETD